MLLVSLLYQRERAKTPIVTSLQTLRKTATVWAKMRAERRKEEREWLILFKWQMREEKCILLPFQISKTSTALKKGKCGINAFKKQKILFILANNITWFQPTEGLLNYFMAVNRNRRCFFESTAQSRDLCVHKALRRTEFSAVTHPEESSQLWDLLFTRCGVSANQLFTFSPNAYSICNDLSPPQPAAFINWDKPSDNWNLSRAVWGNRSQKCHIATEKIKYPFFFTDQQSQVHFEAYSGEQLPIYHLTMQRSTTFC